MDNDLIIKDESAIADFLPVDTVPNFADYTMSDLTTWFTTIDLKVSIYKGLLLQHVKDAERYKELGYATFGEYYTDVLQCKKAYAYQLMNAAGVYTNLSAIADFLPTTESQVRAMTKLEPEQQVDVWSEAIKDGKVPTAKEVKAIVDAKYPKPPKKMKKEKEIVPSALPEGDSIVIDSTINTVVEEVVEDSTISNLNNTVNDLERQIEDLKVNNRKLIDILLQYESKYGPLEIETSDTSSPADPDESNCIVERSVVFDWIRTHGKPIQVAYITKDNPDNSRLYNVLKASINYHLETYPPSSIPADILNCTEIV